MLIRENGEGGKFRLAKRDKVGYDGCSKGSDGLIFVSDGMKLVMVIGRMGNLR